MGGRDWFQASVSAVGIPAVAGSDSGRDMRCLRLERHQHTQPSGYIAGAYISSAPM